MSAFDIVYVSLVGIFNFLLLREFFTYGLGRPVLLRYATLGALVYLAGGIAHRVAHFNPDFGNLFNWLIAVIIPVVLALPSIFGNIGNRGWRSLERGKSLWKSCLWNALGSDFAFRNGIIQEGASQLVTSPDIIKAKTLITAAINEAAQSNSHSMDVLANRAIAWQELGLLHRAVNEFDKAQESYDQSIRALDDAGGSDSNNTRILSAYRDTTFRIGELNQVRGNHAEARKWYQLSLSIDEKQGHKDPIGEQATRTLLGQLDA